MLWKLFEKFYTDSIETIALRTVAENDGISYQSNIRGVYEEYLNQRTALRYLIKSNAVQNQESNELLLDGHKIAACITCALLKVRLIVSKDIDDTQEEAYSLSKSNRYNEQVAMLSGLNCLFLYMTEDTDHLVPKGETVDTFKLIYPKTKYENRSAYLDSLVRGLYYSNLISNVNPLLLSHIFFMLEQYHRKCVELIDEKEYNAKTSLN